MKVPEPVLAEIRARIDLVDLVGAVVPLRRAGERWKGLCPFHQEKTPSFTVHPRLGLFYCFGCHAGGDVFEWVRRQERVEFPEAVRLLAARAGITLESPTAPGSLSPGTALGPLLEWAATRYATWLWEDPAGEPARRYLEGRGLSAETARRFRLGYAPTGWDHLVAAAAREGFAADDLVAAGLAVPRPAGTGHYDRFRGRLVFPIADPQGRVIAFGGRALGDEQPKYLNSPETPLYQKGRTLYALHLARDGLAARRRALVVEGYVDCLMAHQHGFTETVAVLGTALTVHHLALLRRYADEAVLFFDADRAGVEAARRVEELLEPTADAHWWALDRRPGALARGGLRLRVATLPAGDDPDTFLRSQGAAALVERLGQARNLLAFALDRLLAEEDPGTLRGKTVSLARVALLLAKVQDADEAVELGREAARRLGVDPSDLWAYARRLAEAPRPASAGARGEEPAASPPPAFERDLVQCLLQVPEARAALAGRARPEDVSHPLLREILGALVAHPEVAPSALSPHLASDAARGLLSRLLLEERPWGDPPVLIADLGRRLEHRQRTRRIRELSRAIAGLGGGDEVLELQRQLLGEARRVRALLDAGSPAPPDDREPLPASGAGWEPRPAAGPRRRT